MAYKVKARYSVVSGKTRRVVARTKKLTTARKRAEGLVRRGSKRVSIMLGDKLVATMGSFRVAKKRRSTAGRRTSKAAPRRTSRRRTSQRRSSKRRVSKNRHRRVSRRRGSRRRSSKRRTSRR